MPEVYVTSVVESDADLGAWAAVHNAVWTSHRWSPAEARHDDGWLAAGSTRRWIVRRGTETVAAGSSGRSAWLPTSTCAIAVMVVLPGHRRRGIGTALYEQASIFARDQGLLGGLRCMTYGSHADSIAWLEGRGFVEIERAIDVELPIADASPGPVPEVEGVRVVTLADRPDLAHEYHAVLGDTLGDIPGDEQEDVPPFTTWQAQTWSSPGWRADAAFLALDSASDAGSGAERALGVAELEFPELDPDVAWHGYTAVRRDARGRGLGRLLKLHTITYASRAGIRHLRTENEARNAPMRAINRALGYRPIEPRLILRGPLHPSVADEVADSSP